MTNLLDAYKGYFKTHSRFAAGEKGQALPVVTISRETGAGAITIAELAAKRLNLRNKDKEHYPWTVFDQNLVEKMLEDHAMPATYKRFVPEDAPLFNLRSVVEEMLDLHPSDWTLVQHTTDTVLRLARHGNVIFVGRGANVITAGLKAAFHVRLVAPLEARIRHIAMRLQLTEQAAAAYVKERDRARRRYVERNFLADTDDPLQYHVTINTGLMSFDDAAGVIADGVALLK
ncbi:MAG: cytidylate kinase-like family protein [Chthoniobacteraceae bacterium]